MSPPKQRQPFTDTNSRVPSFGGGTSQSLTSILPTTALTLPTSLGPFDLDTGERKMTTTHSELKPGTIFLNQSLGMRQSISRLRRTAGPLYLGELGEGPSVSFLAFSNFQDGSSPRMWGTPG